MNDPGVHVEAGRGLLERLSHERDVNSGVLRWGDGVGDAHLRRIDELLGAAMDEARGYDEDRSGMVW